MPPPTTNDTQRKVMKRIQNQLMAGWYTTIEGVVPYVVSVFKGFVSFLTGGSTTTTGGLVVLVSGGVTTTVGSVVFAGAVVVLVDEASVVVVFV